MSMVSQKIAWDAEYTRAQLAAAEATATPPDVQHDPTNHAAA